MEFRILEGLPAEDVRRFLALARRRTFERDEVVFHRGDPADAVHLITKGRFARRVHSSVGQTAMLAVRGPGDTFGELSLVWTGMSRLVTVSALEPGETLSIAGVSFRGLLGQHPELKDVLVKLLAERLLYSDKRIVAAHFLDADARVRWTLLELAPVYGGDTGCRDPAHAGEPRRARRHRARHGEPRAQGRAGARSRAPRARPRAGPGAPRLYGRACVGFQASEGSARRQIRRRFAASTAGSDSTSFAGLRPTVSSYGADGTGRTSAAATYFMIPPPRLPKASRDGRRARTAASVTDRDVRTVSAVTQAPRRFPGLTSGERSQGVKWRYALLGWLTWKLGKRAVRRRLHLS